MRSIARELDYLADGDAAEPEPLTATEGWIVALIFGGMCYAAWRMPPPDSGVM
ncbi:MAG: hypothetical protein WAK16_06515 [Candidatus Cybelea sp.]